MPKFTPSMRGLAIMALAAAGCGALVVLTLPVGWMEMLVASSGLSETIPAAGPPLGMKAPGKICANWADADVHGGEGCGRRRRVAIDCTGA